MKDEELDSDASDSTVLLTNYYDKPEKNEAKRRRLSNLHDRCHSEHEEENEAPSNANVYRQTNAKGKKKIRRWTVSKYFDSIGDSNPQNNEQENNAGTLKGEIICLDSDDDSDNNGKTPRQDVNVVNFNNPVDQGLLTANLIAQKVDAINTRRTTTDYLGRNDTIPNNDDSQKVDYNKPAIRVLKPSAINARRSTRDFEGTDHTLNNNGRTNISMRSEVEREKIEKTHEFQQAVAVSELQNTDSNAVNVNIDKKNSKDLRVTSEGQESISVVPADLTRTDLTANFKQNDDAFLDAKGNRRILNDERTQPKRSKTDMKSNKNNEAEHTAQAENPEADLQIKNRSSQPACTHTSNEDVAMCDTINKNHAKNYTKAHASVVSRVSKLDEISDVRETSQVLDQHKICVEHVELSRKDSLNMMRINKAQSEQIVKQGIRPSDMQDGQMCESNNHEEKIIINQSIKEQEKSNPFDKQGTRTMHNKSQADNVLDEQNKTLKEQKNNALLVAKTVSEVSSFEIERAGERTREPFDMQQTGKVQEVSSVLVAKTVSDVSSLENVRPVSERTCEQFDKQEIDKVQKLQLSGTKADITVTVDAPVPTAAKNPKVSVDAGMKPKAESTHPKISEMVQSAIKEMKEKSGSSLQDIKKIIAAEYKVDAEKLAPLIRQYLIKAVKSGEVVQKKRQHAADSVNVNSVAINNSAVEDAQIMDKMQHSTDEKEQSKQESEQKIEEKAKNDALNHVHKVQNENVLNQSQIKLAETRMCDVEITSYGTEKVRHASEGTAQDGKLGERRTRNVLDKFEACEQFNMRATDKIENDKETGKAQNRQETDEIHIQQNVARQQSIIPDKPEQSNERDKVSAAHDSQEMTRIIVNNQDAKKSEHDHGVSIDEDSQKKITIDSQNKAQTKIVNDEPETPKSYNEFTNKSQITKCLLQFQIQFFTIMKQNIKTGLYPGFATSFDTIIQNLRANYPKRSHDTELFYCCPKCSHVSTFSSSLPTTDIEDSIDKGSSKKCDICSGIRKLYITYMRRYLSKKVSSKDKERIANSSSTVDDRIVQPVESSENTGKRKSYEPNEEATDPKRIKASAENYKVQMEIRLTTTIDDISEANANLEDEKPNGAALNVKNANTSFTQEIEESRTEGTEVNDATTRYSGFNLNEVETSKKNTELNQNCSTIIESICENTAVEPTSVSQINTSILNNSDNMCNKDVGDENSSKNSVKNEENTKDTENGNNGVSKEIQKATEVRENESNNEINIANTEDINAINKSNMNSLINCFTKIKNLLTSDGENKKGEGSETNTPLTSFVSKRRKSIVKIPESSIDSKRDVQYECPICSCIYVYPARFLSHLRQHNIKTQKIPENCIRFKCKDCSIIFKGSNSFNKHVIALHLKKYTEKIVTANLTIYDEERMASGTSRKKIPLDLLYITSNTRSDSSSDDDADAQSETIDDQTNKCDKSDNIKRISNASEQNISGNESETEAACSDDVKVIHDNKLKRHVYKCLLCKITLASDYSARKHRMKEHLDMIGAPLFKKIQLYPSTDSEQNEERMGCGALNNKIRLDLSNTRIDSSLCDEDAHAQSETIDDQINEHYRRGKKKSRISNANYENISESESEAEDTCSDYDKVINDKKLKRHVFKCLLCKITFASDYSARKHRMKEHLDLKGARIFKEIQLDPTTHSKQNLCRAGREQLSENDDNEKQPDRIEMNVTNDEDRTLINNTETEEADSASETIKASEQAVKNKKERLSKLFRDDEASVSDKISEKDCDSPARSNEELSTGLNDSVDHYAENEDKKSLGKSDANICEETQAAREDESLRPSELTVKKRKEHIKSFLADENKYLLQDTSTDLNHQAKDGNVNDVSDRPTTNIDNNQEDFATKEKTIVCNDDAPGQLETCDDDTTNEQRHNTSVRKIANEEENISGYKTKSEDNVINNNKHMRHVYECLLCKITFPSNWLASKHRMDRHENLRGAQLFMKIQLDSSTSSNDAEKCTDIENCNKESYKDETKADSDDKAVNASDSTIRKAPEDAVETDVNGEKAKRMDRHEYLRGAQLFMKIQLDSSTGANDAEKCTYIENCNKESDKGETKVDSDDKAVDASDSTIRKAPEDAVETDVNGEKAKRMDRHEYLRGAQLFKKIQLDSSTSSNDAEKCTDIENCNKESDKDETKADSDDKAVNASDSTIRKASEDAVETQNGEKAKRRDSDRLEIDMIDNLLEEYDSQEKEDQRIPNEKDNRVDQTSAVSNDKLQINVDSKHVQDKTCLDKIQITNVTSFAEKIYLFVCQECQYATDIYDDTIRHCQNHLNDIQDAVTYCNVCQINYDSSCFERHEVSHDKYLVVIKIKFSYRWLFSNWHLVFENMPLSIAEDIQMKSIFKTFSVKMYVKEDGGWHSALYLCATCNTCVPPAEIEKHVRQKCPSINYVCGICDRAFMTYEMREHHRIYHRDETKLFKIIVFNDKNDEAFNLKLLRAKTGKTERSVDIFKCLCGLCFGSLKRFKLHFVDCESDLNDAPECRECTVSRRFPPEELDGHLLLHETGNDFRVHKISFQLESDNRSDETTVAGKDTHNRPEGEDFILNTDILKESSSQNINLTQGESVTTIDSERRIKSDLLKDEVLSQVSQDSSIERNDNPISMTVERDLQIKKDLLKESLSQETAEHETEDFIDLQVKSDLLKDESLSQETQEQSQMPIDGSDILQIEDDELSQSISVNYSDITSDGKDEDSQRGTSNSLEIVAEGSEHLIIIDSDLDSDVEFIE